MSARLILWSCGRLDSRVCSRIKTTFSGIPTMTQITPQSDSRVVHGTAFVLFMAGTLMLPALRRWPWLWLAPFVAYFGLVASVPRLRRSLSWVRFGRMSAAAVAVTLLVMVLTSLALLVFHTTAQPDVRRYRAALPFDALGGVVMAGICCLKPW